MKMRWWLRIGRLGLILAALALGLALLNNNVSIARPSRAEFEGNLEQASRAAQIGRFGSTVTMGRKAMPRPKVVLLYPIARPPTWWWTVPRSPATRA